MFPRLKNAIHKMIHPQEAAAVEKLGDFTITPRVMLISGLAVAIGFVSAFIALALLKLIGFFTNLFFFQRWSDSMASPAANHLGAWEIAVPVVGALIIGLMARFGSERIRGHGIPEAIEAILINGSKVEPKVAILKPLSSAISIGSGGPFSRRPHHYDGRRIRIDDRAALSFIEYGTEDAAGGGRGRRDVGDIRRAGRGRIVGGRTIALRMEAAKPDSSGAC